MGGFLLLLLFSQLVFPKDLLPSPMGFLPVSGGGGGVGLAQAKGRDLFSPFRYECILPLPGLLGA